jgi:glutamate/tyrosine decarboxylase-like PLP-dependent enzyme
MHHLGDEGYLRLTADARRATEAIVAAVRSMPELVLRAEPDAMLLSFGAADPAALDVYAVADALWRRGWYVDRQGPPPSLHLTVNAVHADKVEAFLADLRASIDEVTAASASGDQGAYGTID